MEHAAEEKTILIQHRSVYGVDRFYPSCDAARVFAEIAGTKTLEPGILAKIRCLGYRVVEVDRFGMASAA